MSNKTDFFKRKRNAIKYKQQKKGYDCQSYRYVKILKQSYKTYSKTKL